MVRLPSSMTKMLFTDLLMTPKYEAWIRGRTAGDPISKETVHRIAEILMDVPRNRGGHYSVSALSNCTKQQVYNRIGAEKNEVPFDTASYAVFLDGHYRHLRWQASLLEAKILTHIEVPVASVSRTPPVRGTIDGVNWHEEWGWEFKSIHSRGFSMLSAPNPAHVRQIHGYMLLCGLHKWSLVYEDKDTQDYKEFVVNYEPSLAMEIQNYWSEMEKHVRLKTLPERLDTCERDGMKATAAKRCPYSTICLEGWTAK